MTKMDRTEHCDVQYTMDSNGKAGWAAGCIECGDWVSPQPWASPTMALHDAIAHEAEKHAGQATPGVCRHESITGDYKCQACGVQLSAAEVDRLTEQGSA